MSISWIADFNDPINFLDVFRYKKGSSNNTGWENGEYTKCLFASDVAATAEERMMHLRQSEELLMQEMPILPIFHYTMLYFSSMGAIDFKWAHRL